MIDVIPTGSSVRIQVLADGFATFAEDYMVNEATADDHDCDAAAEGADVGLCGQ